MFNQTNPNAPGSTWGGMPQGDLDRVETGMPNAMAASSLANIYNSPLFAAGASFFGNMYGANKQAGYNKQLAAQQHGYNMELLKYQLDYNSPASQMARFKAAGLNPNLIYGKGTPGNMEQAPRYPDIQAANFQSVFTDLAEKVARLKLMDSQADLTQQKVVESSVKQELQSAQAELVRANPYLNESYVSAMVTQFQAMADMKAQQRDWLKSSVPAGGRADLDRTVPQEVGWIKMNQELQNLYQKFDLNAADQEIKAKILQSKEFQNILSDIQVRWMRDTEMHSDHIVMFVKMIMASMMK